MIFESEATYRVRRAELRSLIFLLCILFVGCAPRTAEDIAADRARVLGTWQYRADGIGALQKGTLQITVREGKLIAHLQDSWRGQVQAQVTVQGNRMEITMDRVRIRGRLEHDRFTGSAYRPMWDASLSTVRHSEPDAQFVARRVDGPEEFAGAPELGCASLLHESSYACRALGTVRNRP